MGLKNLAMLPNYFDYVFVQLRQKARLRPQQAQNFVNFRPEPELTYNFGSHFTRVHCHLKEVVF